MASQVAVIRATLKYKTQDEMIRGMAPHISKRGLVIHTRQTREVGSGVQFEFKLADGSRVYTGEGIVRQILDGTKPGMLIALKRVNHSFKEVVDAVLSGVETKESGSAFSQHIVQGAEAGDILGDLDLDSGLDSLFSSIEKTPSERKSAAPNALFAEQYDISDSFETPSLSFEEETPANTSANERGEFCVDDLEAALGKMADQNMSESVKAVSEPVKAVSEPVKAVAEEHVNETEQFFAVKRGQNIVDAADEELKSIQAQTAKAPEKVLQPRVTTLTGFQIEEESSADLFAALQNEIFGMPSSDNAILPESVLAEPEKQEVPAPSPANHPAVSAPLPGLTLGSVHIAPAANAEVKHIANPLLNNRTSAPAPKALSLNDLIHQTSADAMEQDENKPSGPKPVARKHDDDSSSLDALLKRADIKSKNVIMTDVNTRKATPHRRNTSEDGEPMIPVQKKGGFLSNLFKK